MSKNSFTFELLPPNLNDSLIYSRRTSYLPYMLHFHEEFELIYFQKAEGKLFLNEEVFEIQNGSIIFIPGLMLHNFSFKNQSMEYFILQGSKSKLESLAKHFTHRVFETGSLVHLKGEEKNRIDFLFEWYDKEKNKELRADVFNLLLHTVFSLNVNLFLNQKANMENSPSLYSKILPLLKNLEEKSLYSISLERAATYCGFSKFHFSREFKKIFKIGFSQYMLKRSINESVKLLTQTNKSIFEISYDLGFCDAAYFCRVFREQVGHTPGQLRNNVSMAPAL